MKNRTPCGTSTAQSLVRFTLAALCAASLSGCNAKNEETGGPAAAPNSSSKPSDVISEVPTTGKTFLVGVSLRDQSAFDTAMRKAMEATAAHIQLTLDVQSADSDPRKQAQQVEAFIEEKTDAILLCPATPEAANGAIGHANAAKIPVFAALLSPHTGAIVSLIASDDAQSGQKAAQALAALLHEKGALALLGSSNRAVSGPTQGFQAEIAKHPGIKILADTAGTDRPDAARSAISRYGRQLNGFFCLNDTATTAAIVACHQAQRPDIQVVGYDADAPQRDEKRPDANLKAVVLPLPEKIGARAITVLADYLRRKNVAPPPIVRVAPGIVDLTGAKR